MKIHRGQFYSTLSTTGMYNGVGDHYTHEACFGLCGKDLHDDVGTNLVPVDSENGTYSTNLYTQKAVEIIENSDSGQVFTRPLFQFDELRISLFSSQQGKCLIFSQMCEIISYVHYVAAIFSLP